ncbi:hypothetical protein TPHA_0L00740 [Tetrapisispora phaffii CBS 4417]|uniref:phosphoinositide 5-phosphatase n=1 Tax=Tetrapisispora phaffii (strain ATCC 24235 / CBS 4417 / NBRC 1672 / NRRL Y-8282 / UCD 70-5) TaxID=1071381 RepID=G8BZV2_TETPH|nr:hypothetical protein TPHA_0L00740 [Tetrapisispora phaffii CBS 4417]CCE65430.1 hypothetical protein TPHA_0L00740 [Tetrapisispora phaffii CBS 4417]
MKVYLGREPREIVISSNGHNLSFRRFYKPLNPSQSQQSGSVPLLTVRSISDSELSSDRYFEIQNRLFYGLIGVLSIESDIFIGVITGIQKVGFPRWNNDSGRIVPADNVIKVLNVEFYSLDNNIFDYLIYDIVDQNLEKIIMNIHAIQLKNLLSDGTFYFSREYDLSNAFKTHALSHNLDYIIDNQDFDYIWNRSLLNELITWRERAPPDVRQQFDAGLFFTFLIRGYCKTTLIEELDNTHTSITVISRISTESKQNSFALTGVNEDGKITDLIETEVIISTDKFIFSYSQVSANVPLFWEAVESQLRYGKKYKITKDIDNTQVAFDRHFDNLEEKYGVVSIVNVVKPKSETQELIASTYEKCASARGLRMVNLHYNSDAIIKSPQNMLLKLEQDIYELGAFIYDINRGIYIGKQTGVLRISVLDSVKKINLIEKLVSKEVMELMTKEILGFDMTDSFIEAHNKLWNENYYWLDRMYSKNTKNFGKYRKVYTKIFLSRVKVYDPLNPYVSKHLRQLRSNYSYEKDISIFAGTFNTSGKISTEDLSEWLLPKDSKLESAPDIYLIGLEEVVELTPGQMLATDPYVKQHWEKEVLHTINNGRFDMKYVSVWSSQLGGVLLMLLLSESEYMKVKHIEGDVKKTGFGGMGSNKGAVAVSFKYSATRFCVIVSHLAAGLDNVEQRHSDYKTIAKNIRFSKGLRIKDHDAIIWMGDFNYRILMTNEEVRRMIITKEYSKLFERDQLNQQMIAGASFPYYHEMEIKFPPTYKFDAGTKTYDTSEKMRIPAWTDRILNRGELLTQLSYGCAEDILYSDHRPVYATFKAVVTVVDEQKKTQISKDLYEFITGKLSDLSDEEKVSLLNDSTFVTDSLKQYDDTLAGQSPVVSHQDVKRGMKLPAPSSDTKKWWIGNGKQAKVVLDVDSSSYVLNPNRSSNPFIKDDDLPIFIPK